MSFSNEWDERYTASSHLSVWPWSDVVSLVHRHCRPLIAGRGRVLELGCGAGANIPLFRALNVEYFGIDGSPTIVKQLQDRYRDTTVKIVCGDFTVDQNLGAKFDLVLDRASVTHNNTASIARALRIAFDSLNEGGLFIGVDWFSKNHTDFLSGDQIDDEYTRCHHADGPFAGVGKVHFSDELHMRDLFHDFEVIYMEEKLIRRCEPKGNYQIAAWNIVARKPHA